MSARPWTRAKRRGPRAMPLEQRAWVTEEMMAREPNTLFVFGDNLARWGKGGQAAVMRGKPNAVGLPTKRHPGLFLCDDDYLEVVRVAGPDVHRLHEHLVKGGVVVWPMAGIGTGLAKLQEKAPEIAAYYDAVLEGLRDASAAIHEVPDKHTPGG